MLSCDGEEGLRGLLNIGEEVFLDLCAAGEEGKFAVFETGGNTVMPSLDITWM